jgi:hypothetical protein
MDRTGDRSGQRRGGGTDRAKGEAGASARIHDDRKQGSQDCDSGGAHARTSVGPFESARGSPRAAAPPAACTALSLKCCRSSFVSASSELSFTGGAMSRARVYRAFFFAFFQRVRIAFRANARRSSAVSFAMRALPPFEPPFLPPRRPRVTAAGFFWRFAMRPDSIILG